MPAGRHAYLQWLLLLLLSDQLVQVAMAGSTTRRTPLLGWTSWATIGCSIDCEHNPDYCLSERVLKQMMDAVVDGGWKAAGYTMLHVDDCAFTVRDNATGELVADPRRFTNGTFEALAAYAHSKGLQLGAYLDMGNHTCDWGHPPPPKSDGEFPDGPGSYLHEATDIFTLARWGIDQVKVDGCYRPDNTTRYWLGFSMMAEAIARSGRDIWLACEAMMYMEHDGCSDSTPSDPKCATNFSAGGPARLAAYRRLLAPGQCNSMTVKLDDVQNHFLPSNPPEADGLDGSVSSTIDFFGNNQDVLAGQVTPGHYNDPEWILAGTSGQWMPDYRPKHQPFDSLPFVLTPSQTTAQFVLYSLLSVPMLLGLDFRRLNQHQHADLRALLQNPDIIAISRTYQCSAAACPLIVCCTHGVYSTHCCGHQLIFSRLCGAEDALSEQGRRLHSRPSGNSTLEVWTKHLSGGALAVVLFNHCRQPICSTTSQPLGSNTALVNVTLQQLGLANWPAADVRDLVNRQNVSTVTSTGSISAKLGADAVALFKLTRASQ